MSALFASLNLTLLNNIYACDVGGAGPIRRPRYQSKYGSYRIWRGIKGGERVISCEKKIDNGAGSEN